MPKQNIVEANFFQRGFENEPTHQGVETVDLDIDSIPLVGEPVRVSIDEHNNYNYHSLPFFMGLIIGHTNIQINSRWSYKIRILGLTGDTDQPNAFEELTNMDEITATNLMEITHETEPDDDEEPWYIWGIDVHNPPTGVLLPLPIGSFAADQSHTIDTPVQVFKAVSSAKAFFVFNMVGNFFPSCNV